MGEGAISDQRSAISFQLNARTHSDEQVAQVAASIVEFGWTNPILVGADGVIIAGHARLLAARKLGMAEVPVSVLDHLTESQRQAFVLADNKLRSTPPRVFYGIGMMCDDR